MKISLLGAVEASVDGTPIALGGPRQRAVLADLALGVGHVVTPAQLIDDVWGERPPPSAKPTLETYISRLRQILTSSGSSAVALVTRPGGYLFTAAAPDCIDAFQFRFLAARGDASLARGDVAEARRLVSSAVELWRGQALADIQDAPFAVLAGRRLEEERLAAIETLVESRLAIGQHRDLVPELQTLISGSPYRERFHAQLIVALYRSGRQADALAVFGRARKLLADDLGIEPGRLLRDLHQAVLLQSPELDLPAARTDVRGQQAGIAAISSSRAFEPRIAASDRTLQSPSTARPGWQAWRWPAVAAALGLVAAVVVPLALRAESAQGNVLAQGIGQLTASGTIARSAVLPTPAEATLMADGSIWVTSPAGNVVYRVNPATDTVDQTIPVGSGPSAITASGSDIWVANTLDGTVSRISAMTSQVVQTIDVGTEPTGITSGDGSIWVADPSLSILSALSPASGTVMSTIPLSSPPFAVAYGAGSLWVTSPTYNTVTRIDPDSDEPGQQIQVGSGPTAIDYGLDSVWVANGLDSTVTRLNPASDAVADTIRVGDGPDALAVSGGSVWVANRLSDTLTRISAGTDGSAKTVHLGGSPTGLAPDGTSIWVAAGAPISPHPSGGTLRVLFNDPPASIDPALIYPLMFASFSDATYDTLVTFQKTGGNSGLQLVPDLALAMPIVSPDGKTYTFTLRSGLQYSNGRLVRPQDFRYAIERDLDLNPDDASFLDGIVGASACPHGKLCNLAGGVVVDDGTNSITFHLAAPDPYFLDKLAFEFTAPVPAYVPAHDVGLDPAPATGPYMITRYVPGHEVVFSRNPYFREWSAAAQPYGSPDRIIWTFGTPLGREEAEIKSGVADWTNDVLPDVGALAADYPDQVHRSPLPSIVYTSFNTTAAPFNDPNVRRAFSLAVNRGSLVAAFGGPELAQPACQILPPGIPGHQPYCPFTVDPSASGAWVGPDLATARRLVAASGTRGMRVTVLTDNLVGDPPTAALTVSVLRELGYRASMQIVPHADVVNETNTYSDHVQATVGIWSADYPSASDFLDLFFRCSDFSLTNAAATRNGSFFCDPAGDRLMNLADSEQATNPQQADVTWAAADRAVTYAAPWVILANLENIDFLSARVSNYQYNPFLGVLLDQLQIHRDQQNSK
jgi:YVTN family beta-propeller protein